MPRRAVLHGHRLLRRQGRGHQRAPAAVEQQAYGPGNYMPVIPVTYWTFRLMIGFGMLAALLSRDRAVAHPPPRHPAGAPLVLPGRVRRARPPVRRQQRRAGSSPRWAASPGRCSACSATADGVSTSVGVASVLDLADRLHAALRRARRGRTACSWSATPRQDRPRRPRSRPWPTTTRRGPRPWRTEGDDHGTHRHLVPAHRGPVDRLLRPRGLRLRRRHAAAAGRAHRDTTAGVAINTIGPVWDGNEVWLLVAGGATFAAFPEWYASLFSGFYLALLLILRRADPARGGLRVPRQDRQRPLAPQLGHRDHRAARRCPRCCGAWRSRTSCAACRSTSTTQYTGTLLTLLNPYALLGGLDDAVAVRPARGDLPRPEDPR